MGLGNLGHGEGVLSSKAEEFVGFVVLNKLDYINLLDEILLPFSP